MLGKMGKTREMGQDRRLSALGSLSLVAIVVGVLLGLVRDDRMNAAGTVQSGPYRLIDGWPELPPDDPRLGSMSGVAVAHGVVDGLNRD